MSGADLALLIAAGAFVLGWAFCIHALGRLNAKYAGSGPPPAARKPDGSVRRAVLVDAQAFEKELAALRDRVEVLEAKAAARSGEGGYR